LNVTFDTPDGEVTTIAGYLMAKLGRIPERGDTYRIGEYEISVRETDGPRVVQVLIEPRPALPAPPR
jgi:CBS domain containing-hemolysin-like protein